MVTGGELEETVENFYHTFLKYKVGASRERKACVHEGFLVYMAISVKRQHLACHTESCIKCVIFHIIKSLKTAYFFKRIVNGTDGTDFRGLSHLGFLLL